MDCRVRGGGRKKKSLHTMRLLTLRASKTNPAHQLKRETSLNLCPSIVDSSSYERRENKDCPNCIEIHLDHSSLHPKGKV